VAREGDRLVTVALFIIAFVLIAVYFVVVYDNGFSGFLRLEVSPRSEEQRPEGSLRTVYFPAIDGTRLEGWLLLPKKATAPLVIMAPGLTGTKDGHLEPFAWRFVRQGFAALLFDFRCFGGSDGEPRHWVDPFRHADDYRAAVRFAREVLASEGTIDATRIVLWGSSFSGGTVIEVAAGEPDIAAVVAQAPFVDTPKELEPKPLALLRYIFWTTLDLTRQHLASAFRIKVEPVYVPVFGRPGEFAFAPSRENPSRLDPSEPGALFWRTLPSPPRGGWENKLLARLFTELNRFKPIDRIGSIGCPIYLIAAESDDLALASLIKRAFERVSHAAREITIHPCGHFDLYLEPVFSHNADLQAEFLDRFVGSGIRPSTHGLRQTPVAESVLHRG